MSKSDKETSQTKSVDRRHLIIVVGLLSIYAALSLSAASTKCATFDEGSHLILGYTIWEKGDFRFLPEAAILERWQSLPIYLAGFRSPSYDDDTWRNAQDMEMAGRFLYESGNDADKILFYGRLMNLIIGVGLGVFIYRWSAALFGVCGGLISLALFSFSPSMLAHGSLMTPDAASTFFIVATSWALWIVLHRLTLATFMRSSLIMGAFFCGKVTAVVIVPIGTCLLLARIFHRRPWKVSLFGWQWQHEGRFRQLLVGLVLIAAHIFVAWAMIWATFNYRFSMFADRENVADPAMIDSWWTSLAERSGSVGTIAGRIHDYQLLPEGYIKSVLYSFGHTRSRYAFLNGQYSASGWWYFFPYCLLVKTPLTLFGILGLAAVAYFGSRNENEKNKLVSNYDYYPLVLSFAIYWLIAITSSINIGHRHILPTYPAMFIFAGITSVWFKQRTQETNNKAMRAILVGLLILHGISTVAAWPNYIAYFNPIVGSKNAHERLLDSSLDWGQDLPALAKWVHQHNDQRESHERQKIYLAYFGSASSPYYGINATAIRTPGRIAMQEGLPVGQQWSGGIYCISASARLRFTMTERLGSWSDHDEQMYRQVIGAVRMINDTEIEEKKKRDMLAIQNYTNREALLQRYDEARSARLIQHLHNREPDHLVNRSILVYLLSSSEVKDALFGPPP